MRDRKFLIVSAAIVAAAALAGGWGAHLFAYRAGFAAANVPPPAPSADVAAAVPMDTAGWSVYAGRAFGFSFEYPPGWQVAPEAMSAANPHVALGNPLGGTATYRMDVWAYGNPGGLSAAGYVAAMIASDTAADVRSGAANGTAPRITPRFSKEFALTVKGIPAYELYDVFEFDHQGEQIYIKDGIHMLVFDFPVSAANPNIADPGANNIVAHAVLDTLRISSSSSVVE